MKDLGTYLHIVSLQKEYPHAVIVSALLLVWIP